MNSIFATTKTSNLATLSISNNIHLKMHLDTHIKWQFLDQNHWLMYFTGGSQDSKSIHPCGITACVQTKGRACWSI